MSAEKKITFSGKGQAGDLSDPNNWAGGIVPGDSDTALINMNIGGPIEGTFSVNNMMILGSEEITVAGTLDTLGVGGPCQGLMVCVGAGMVFDAGAVLNDGNALIIGNGKVGTLVADGVGSDHSVLNSVSGYLGLIAGGVGTATIDDGIWNNSGVVYVGAKAQGTLNVTNDGVVNVGGTMNVAVTAGATGALNVASGGEVNVAGALSVGSWTDDSTASASVGAGASVSVGDQMLVGDGVTLTMAGGTVAAGETTGGLLVWTGGTVAGHGTLTDPDGTAIWDYGVIQASGGTLDVSASVHGTGVIQIEADSTAMLTGGVLGFGGIAFIGADSTLALASGGIDNTTISGFSLGDMITMANINTASFNASTGVLRLSENSTFVENLHLAGNFSGDTFSLHTSGAAAVITLQHS